MERWLGGLCHVQQFFKKLLTLSQTGVFNLDILRTTELYHALGKIVDLHWLAHIEDEYLAAVAFRTCLEYQFTGLRYQHEVSDDVRMGDRHRTAVLDLFLKQRDDRAI